MILLPLVGAALADGYSTDIELVRPSFSPGTPAGIDSPVMGRPGTVRVGSWLQYERDPLILYQVEREAGSVVANRLMGHLGVSVDLAKRFSARFVLPIGGQWGSEVDSLGADTGGLGDATLGARYQLPKLGPLTTGLRADVYLPFGTHSAYLGEENPRGQGGILAEARFGPLALLGDFSVVGRAPVTTEQDFTLGSELAMGAGARLDIWPENVSLNTGVLARSGFTNFFAPGGETPAEIVAGLQVRPAHDWRLDVAIGRGIAPGYGSTQFRFAAGITWQRTPPLPPAPAPEPLTRLAVTEAPDLPPEAPEPEVEPPKPAWKEDELARVEEEQIVIRDPIQFELATNKVLPESIPTLHAIAKLLDDHPEIAHVVIEGHASEEGSFAYNYDLSIRRSLAIFQELVLAGVYPARLSCRGMGEVEPVTLGADEAELAKNRRVIFHIVRRLRAGEPSAPIRTDMLLPWNGTPQTFTPPPEVPIPATEPEPEKKKAEPAKQPADYPTDPNTFNDDEDDGDQDAPKKKEGK